MAQKYIVQLVDDLTQEQIEEGAGENIRFGLDGISYVIDLTPSHAAELRAAFAPYVAAGRRADSGPKPQRIVGVRSKGDLKAIRDWANANGFSVSTRGRIPANVQEAYAAAH